MYSKYAESIRLKIEYSLESDPESSLFGITDRAKLFGGSSEEATVGLFYDSKNGVATACDFISKVKAVKSEAEAAIASGKKPGIPKKYQGVLKVVMGEEGLVVEQDNEEYQRIVDRKGYSAIGTSRELSADELNTTYHSRDASEKGFRADKTELGNDVWRVHNQSALHAKFFVGFIASNIRNELQKACKKVKYATNLAIRELRNLQLFILADGSIRYVHMENYRQEALLTALCIDARNLDEVADDLKQRLSDPNKDPRRRMAVYSLGTDTTTMDDTIAASAEEVDQPNGSEPGKGEAPQDKSGTSISIVETVRRKGGRPKGSLNKKTVERLKQEAEEAAARVASGEPEPIKRKRGRPKGSLNKKTIERLHLEHARNAVDLSIS